MKTNPYPKSRQRLALAAALILASLLSILTQTQGAQSQPNPNSPKLELETSCLRAVFSAPAHGALVSLVDKQTGRELIAQQARPRLFELEFSDAHKPAAPHLTLSSWDAASVELVKSAGSQPSAIRFSFPGHSPAPVQARLLLSADPADPMLRCRIEVTVPEPLVLEKVRFPMVTLRPQPAGAAPDAVLLGATKGGVYPRPSAAPVGTSLSAGQPGNMAAQFGCWYNDQVGLFTAACDSRGYRKTLNVTRGADGLTASWFLPAFERRAFVQDFDFVLTTFHGADPATPPDWRDAADLYKAWALQQPWCARTLVQRADLPAWLKEGPAMVRFSRDWLRTPESVETWLKTYWKNNFPQGTPLVIAYWGWEKVETWITPDYFPVYPSDEAFRHLAEVGRTLGGHTFLWPSGYHYTLTFDKRPDGTFAWDDRKRFDAEARPHAVITREGKLYQREASWLRGGATTCMCPGDPWTIDWFNRIATGLAERGAELVQVDQVVGGNFPPCYAEGHGHAPGPGGLWATEVFRRQLQSMLEACRKIQPGAVVCFEEPNELFIQQAGIQDYRDWEVLKQAGAEPASVFNYLYHEFLPTFQSNPRRGDRLMAAWCLANGQIPHMVPEKTTGPGPLLVGGDFETPGANAPAGWDHVPGYQGRVFSGETARDEAEHREGRASLRLANRGADEIAQASQNIAVDKNFAPGRTCQLSAWIKTRDLKKPNGILLGAFGPGMRSLGSWRIAMLATASDWTRGQVRFTLPAGAALLRIMINLQGPGTVWVDEMKLEEVRADGSLAEVPRPTQPSDHDFMAGWVRLFHGEGRPYLLLGRFLHPPRLECAAQQYAGRSLPAILHNAFAAPDGSQAVILVNATDAPQTGRLTWQGQTRETKLAPWEARLVR